jgi:hypothetical protein
VSSGCADSIEVVRDGRETGDVGCALGQSPSSSASSSGRVVSFRRVVVVDSWSLLLVFWF